MKKFFVIILSLFLFIILSIFLFKKKNTIVIDIKGQKFDRYIVEKDNIKHFSNDKKQLENIVDVLKNKTTNKESVNDRPVNVGEYYLFELYDKEQMYAFYVYEKNKNYILEVPYNGIYTLEKEEFFKIVDVYKVDDIDKLYSRFEVKNKNIKFLNEYSDQQMVEDKCVLDNAKGTNFELFEDFEKKALNNQDAYIRIVRRKSEEKIYVIDLFYISDEKVYLVIDKDVEDDKSLVVKKFKKMSLQNFDKINYKVLYNEDGDIKNETVFKLLRY